MTIGRRFNRCRTARATLERWMRRPKTAQALALRARMVLACAEGKSNTAVAEDLGITRPTVGKWRRRFLEFGVDGLLDEPRPGVPRTVTDEQVEALLTRTLETMPRNATHWSTRSMAQESGLSQSTVGRIWRAFGLQPHRTETFKLSKDRPGSRQFRSDALLLSQRLPHHNVASDGARTNRSDRTRSLLSAAHAAYPPAVYIVLFLTVGAVWAGWLVGEADIRAVALQAVHLSNYQLIIRGHEGYPLGTFPYWSLAVEEHFYLAFPVIYMVALRLAVPAKAQWIGLGVVCAIVLT